MVLLAAGLATSLVGAGLNFAAGRKRERAVARAQEALRAATEAFYEKKQERADVIGLEFERLSAQNNTSLQNFIDQRNSAARERAGIANEEGTAANMAIAQGDILKSLLPPTGVEARRPAAGGQFRDALAAQMAQIQPRINTLEEQILAASEQRGQNNFVRDQRDILGLQLADIGQSGQELGINSQITEAVKANDFAALQRNLGLDLNRAGRKGDELALGGAVLQLGGNFLTGLGAAQVPAIGQQNIPPELGNTDQVGNAFGPGQQGVIPA